MHEVLCQRLSHWIKYDKVMESKTVFNDNDSIVVSFWQMAMAGWQGRSRKHASISFCPTSKRLNLNYQRVIQEWKRKEWRHLYQP